MLACKIPEIKLIYHLGGGKKKQKSVQKNATEITTITTTTSTKSRKKKKENSTTSYSHLLAPKEILTKMKSGLVYSPLTSFKKPFTGERSSNDYLVSNEWFCCQ